MAKIDITKTELVWPGKYNEDGTLREVPRVNLPFQVIETVNESRATREVQKVTSLGLFDVYEGQEGDTFEAGWRNKLIWGDNLLVMASLLERFAGKIDLIYIDPPFATGADFSFRTKIGDSGEEILKEQSVIEEKAYRDTWGRGTDSYLSMIYERMKLMRELLSDTGSIYIHCDYHVGHLIRNTAEEVFGADCFLNEIVWKRSLPHNDPKKYGRIHDTILFFVKSPSKYAFNQLFTRQSDEYIASHYTQRDPDGRVYRLQSLSASGKGPPRRFNKRMLPPPPGTHWRFSQEKIDELLAQGLIVFTSTGQPNFKRYLDESKGSALQSLWIDVNPLNPQALERLDYATQKPEALLHRIINTSSNAGDLVADFFCGSGTTLAAAETLRRRWIGCDLGRWAIHTTRKRLLGIKDCKPLEVLNLGKYERQYWQGVTFGIEKDKPLTERALYEYLAFILKLYGAQPVVGMTNLHGKKSKAMIHIGAVDAPVTITEIDAAVDECVKLKQGELHVLGWEWEMGLYDLMVEVARRKRVKLLLLQIPREVMEQQAAAKGDVRFFELAYLEAEIKQPKKLTAHVALKDFVIPNTELIPEEVRSKIRKWSDYIDYWAVDWDFQSDTFMQGWVTYRTRKERSLSLVSDPNIYKKPGTYRILVKVIDIFGNDTSQAFDVEVK
jgi:DNA modification methylase